MAEAVLSYFIHNGKSYDISKFDEIYQNKYPSIYEVIRIIDGVPLFLEEHYERLLNSTEILGSSLNKSLDDIRGRIMEMVKVNNTQDYNIKIVINDLETPIPNEYYFFIKSVYPGSEMYISGIETILYEAERSTPQAKVINQSLRDEVDSMLKRSGAYEALLVNSRQEVTEGSRSNAFFIRDGIVYTAPEKDVLSGITRKRIITLCTANNIQVEEAPILTKNLEHFEALFISGTSPKVLPVSKIDGIDYDVSNVTLRRVMNIYDSEIMEYLKNHK